MSEYFAKLSTVHRFLLLWCVLANALTFILFAWDKFKAGVAGRDRVSEFQLVTVAAAGGWPAGLLAMLLFRHKTAKLSFQLKYAAAFCIWAGLMYGAFRWL